MSHPYKADAKKAHDAKLKSYGAKDGGSKPKNWAGFEALNTDSQAGRAPTSSTEYEAPERRIQRKKGGAVKGAQSLKRLDKAPRKGKDMGGARVGPVPSADKQQEDMDPTTKFMQGKMSPNTMRKKGGRIAKAAGGSLEDILAGIADSIFGAEEEAPAASATSRPGARPASRHAAPTRHVERAGRAPVVRQRVTEVEHPVDIPRPPRRPAMGSAAGRPFADPGAAENLELGYHGYNQHPKQEGYETALGLPRDEASMRSFLDREMGRSDAAPVSFGSGAPSMAATGAPDESGMRSFLESQGIGRQPEVELSTPELTRMYNRKKGGRVQDFEARSHESQAGQGLRRAKGGKMSEMEWEHSKKDLTQDKKLAKKHGMSMEKWEKSDLDKKHDKQQSTEGLKRGGRTKRADGGGAWEDYGGAENGGSSSKGGKSKKGGSVVNVIIGGMPGQQQQNGAMDALINAAMAAQAAGGPPPGAMPPPPPPAAPPQGGAPMMAAPPMMPPQMPPQAGPGGPPMPRKSGGSVQVPYKKPGRTSDGYPALDFGSGSGFGRKQKADSYGTKGPNSKNNY